MAPANSPCALRGCCTFSLGTPPSVKGSISRFFGFGSLSAIASSRSSWRIPRSVVGQRVNIGFTNVLVRQKITRARGLTFQCHTVESRVRIASSQVKPFCAFELHILVGC